MCFFRQVIDSSRKKAYTFCNFAVVNLFGENSDQPKWGLPKRKAAKLGAGDGVAKTDGQKPSKKSHRRQVACTEISDKTLCRRAWGVERLLSCLGMEKPKKGYSYHIMTGGNVDTLSFVKGLMLHHNTINRLIISTWVISGEDALQLREWVESGKVNNLDIYLGEIYPNQYKVEWHMLRKMFNETRCGRLCYFANHAKVCLMDVGGGDYYTIEGSANLNTNPRNEQGIITNSKGLYDFYKEYYDSIKTFNYNEGEYI